MSTIASILDLALAGGYGDFTATRTELEPIRDTGPQRCDIKLAYKLPDDLTPAAHAFRKFTGFAAAYPKQ